ncbi:MAG: hypothetical protein RSD49_01495 [Hafnia sp.]
MHSMQLRFVDNRFAGYEFSATVKVQTELSAKMQKKLAISEILGDRQMSLVTPIADIDLMLELVAKKFSLDEIVPQNHMDDVTIDSIIDEDGHSHESTALSALLAWMNHYDLADDLIRESVVDLTLYDQRMILTYCERHAITGSKLGSLIGYFTEHPESALLKMSLKMAGKSS